MLDFVNQVMGAQPPQSTLDVAVMPNCGSDPIKELGGTDLRCLFYRILERLPEPDDPGFLKAQTLLRETYPDATSTPTETNFLIAFVELGSGLARVKAFLQPLDTSGTDGANKAFKLSVHHLKRFFTELQNGLIRMRYSYQKVSQFVVQQDGKPLVEVGNQKLVFSEELGVPAILRFLGAVIHENAVSVDGQLNEVARDAIYQLGRGTLETLRALDLASFQGDGFDDLQVMFQFESGIEELFAQLADSIEQKQTFDIFEMAWNDPPRILAKFADSARKSWNEENLTYLQNYYLVTQNQWVELQRLEADWPFWFQNELDQSQRDGLLLFLQRAHREDPRLSGFSGEVTLESLKNWQTAFVTGMISALKQALDGHAPEIPNLNAQAALDGILLLQRTQDWVNQNLW
jgi:hypothetical protein